MEQKKLYIFSGLPGVGKSSLAKLLAQKEMAFYLRIDTIEQGLRDFCHYEVYDEGYSLAYNLCSDQLRLGTRVVVDCVNPLEITRERWINLGKREGYFYWNIEVICSDLSIHQKRIETRTVDVPNLRLPNWERVEALKREYMPWKEDASRIQIDTAHKSLEESFQDLLGKIY